VRAATERPAAAVGLSVLEVDLHNVDLAVRGRSAAGPTDYLPFVCRAVVDALAAFPRLNGWLDGPDVRPRERVDLGVDLAVDATADDAAPAVPVLVGADGLRLAALARGLAAPRAPGGRPASFTIVHSGCTGAEGSTGIVVDAPVLRPPAVATLSLGAVLRRVVPVPAGDTESIAIHHVGHLALSWDRRAASAAYVAGFLARVGSVLQERDWSVEL
jgi:pyruvate/2-oxoglutarate dehydrogenase complex dihydrolipoamide acyltransferase (E2) component